MRGLSALALLGCMTYTFGVVLAQEAETAPLQKLPYPLNTDEYDEGGPVLSMDGALLYFTRSGSPDFNRTLLKEGHDLSTSRSEYDYKQILGSIYSEIANRNIAEPYSSNFNQDIWIAHLDNDTITGVSHPDYPINNALPNSVVSARLDTNRLVVINQFYRDGSMYEGFSSVEEGYGSLYGFPKPLHIYNFYNNSSDVNLALSTRGQVMILSLDRKDSQGKKDLYISYKISGDLWSEPEDLGPVLNTTSNETTPFISEDNRRLYFASDRPGTMGGLDIYMSERLDYTWKRWTEPVPLEAPINSTSDDMQPFLDHLNKHFYFASRRDGSCDIFRQPLQPKPRLEAPIVIKGRVIDGLTLAPIRAEILYGPSDTRSYLEYVHTFTGDFSIELTEYGVYKFLAHKPGYQDAVLMFDTRQAEKAHLAVHEITLSMYRDSVSVIPDPHPLVITDIDTHSATAPVAVVASLKQQGAESAPEPGKRITFHNIYFERSKPVILPTSDRALNDLYQMMISYPDLHIRIEGHTDNVGDEHDLMELSWQRAQAVKVFLMDKGVDRSRITTIGYGDSHPIADNLSEASRSKNRRVEVTVQN